MSTDEILLDALKHPKDAIFYALSKALASSYPQKAILESEDHTFDLHSFAYEGHCNIKDKSTAHSEWTTYWDQQHDRIAGYPFHVWFQVEWKGKDLEVLRTQIQGTHCAEVRSYVIADSQEVAEAFFEEVCVWNSEIRGEILVFADGHWAKSTDLFESIRKTTLESLVLAGSLKEDILADFKQYFQAKSTYERYGIPWKRGVLLLGPPGNGKTHAIKGIVNELKLPCLYVRSFNADYVSDQHNISEAFKRARASAPCLFVLEDLDSLLNEGNRSFFLNELDGFSANEGLLTIATTNHPDRLDPAIVDRPSRFDRKYTFELPALEERKRYLAVFGSGLDPELQLSETALANVGERTEGFSFAYLKELYLSAMMEWISNPKSGEMETLMCRQSETLLSQMSSAMEFQEVVEVDGENEMFAGLPPMVRRQAQRYLARSRRT